MIEDASADKLIPLTSFNDAAKSARVPEFAKYTFFDEDTDVTAKMDSYDKRLEDLATTANISLPGKVLRDAHDYAAFAGTSAPVCFVGDPAQVAAVAQAGGGTVVGEMYRIWGWRHGTQKHTDPSVDDADALGDAWTSYRTSSTVVRLVYTNDDDGTATAADDVAPCR